MTEHEHHHHSHDDNCCCEKCRGISISDHEGALICTLEGYIPASNIEDAKERISCAMKQLASRIVEAGGIIGHIKAIVSEEGRGYQISVTDDEAIARILPPSSYSGDCAVIVFAVEENVLRKYIQDTVGGLIVSDNTRHGDDCGCEHEHK